VDSPAWVILTTNETPVRPVVDQFGIVTRGENDIHGLHTAEPIGDCGTGAVVLQGEIGCAHIVDTHHTTIDVGTAGRGNARQVAGGRAVQPLEGAAIQNQIVGGSRNVGGVALVRKRSTASRAVGYPQYPDPIPP